MELKYVRHSTIGFILWPLRFGSEVSGNLFHSHVGAAARASCGGKIVSAGFCRLDTAVGKAECFGHSESLGMSSLPEDSDLLTAQLFGFRK